MRTLLLAVLAWCSLAGAAGVEMFTPQGTVKEVRQVSARFGADMVPLGDPGLPDPFVATCAVAGRGHWVDTRNWVYDFERDLPGGLSCRFSLLPGLQDLSGQAVAEQHFAFDTGGPTVLETHPADGSRQIQEDQVFLLGLDALADPAQLATRLWCRVDGVAERIAFVLLTAAERRQVLAASSAFLQSYFTALDQRHGAVLLLPEPGGSRRDQLLRAATEGRAPLVAGRCARRLPSGHKVALVWGKGIASATGVLTTADQVLDYAVQPEFSAHLRCQRLQPKAPCLSVLPLELGFSAPIPLAQARRISLAAGTQRWGPVISAESVKSGEVSSVSFLPPFPEQAELRLTLPARLRDASGRALANARSFPLTVSTDLAPPLAKFAAGFGIYERDAEPALPLTLRYVSPLTQAGVVVSARHLVTSEPHEVIEWLRRLHRAGHDDYGPFDQNKGYAPVRHFGAEDSVFGPKDGAQVLALPRTLPENETEVIGIPLPETGLHVVEVASPRLGRALMDRERPYHVRAAALVTGMAVHFKRGRESSLVWVTHLADGSPVDGAEVAVRSCTGQVFAHGRTDVSGLWHIQRKLPAASALAPCLESWDREFFVTASQGGDFSFVLSDWGDGIAPWRFNLLQGTREAKSVTASAVLDRGLYRAGEPVGIKLYARLRTQQGFALLPPARLGQEVVLRHRGGEAEVKLPVKWDRQGIAELEYTLPREARQGTWDILVQLAAGHEVFSAGSFRVAAFRVPTVRAALSGPARAVRPAEVALDLQAVYLAGGAAAFLPVTLRGQLQPLELRFPGHEQASIANGRVRSGEQAIEADWHVGDYDVDPDVPAPAPGGELLRTQRLSLDAGGSARAVFGGLPPLDTPRQLLAEAEYRDANGETRSTAARVALFPSEVLAGVDSDRWSQPREAQHLTLLALDPGGAPRAGMTVTGRLYQANWYSYRKRVIGGFYAYTHLREVKSLGEACRGLTDERGAFQCITHTEATGQLILEAEVRDAQGNASFAQKEFWIAEGDGWADASDNDRMDLIPEQRGWEPGERARLRLNMPFERAHVLVSVEREGVLDAWVTELTRDNPVLEVPIKPEYGPNVFVSALAVRGRSGGVQPTARVDLGKPAFRLGMAELQVGWSGYALNVNLDTDRAAYRTRERVRLHVSVRRPDGSPPGGGEVAVAAVDEALLELAPNVSWKLLDSMMQRRGIEVITSTAQMQVVGKRHYGRKAVPAGGGGGRGAARELFDTRILWKARVPLDEQGEARLEVPLNDSLSRFRLVAVASAGAGRFGTGEATVAVTQDLQLLSGAAPVVREADRMKVYFTLRNASDHSMVVDVAPRLDGRALAPVVATLEPGQGRELALPVEVPVGQSKLAWDILAQERGGPATDHLRVAQEVRELNPVRTLQATLMQVSAPVSLPVARPTNALAGRGGVSVAFHAGLAAEQEGVREYLVNYPWTCLEQQASRAVGLQDAALWQSLSSRLPAYVGADGLARFWPELREGSDTLTAYLLAVSQEAGYSLPELIRTRLLDGLRAFVEGRLKPASGVDRADLAVRKLAALEALSRYPEAQISPAWLESFSITPERWPTSAVLDWVSLLQRSPQLAGRDAWLGAARSILRSRLTLSGTHLGFSTERTDAWWWLLVDGDSNANRMLLAALDGRDWTPPDLARLLRGALGRQQHGHWSTTVANAWGVLAARRFAARLESLPVTGSTRAQLGEQQITRDWSLPAGAPGGLPWPEPAGTLELVHAGAGAPWVTVTSRGAVQLQEPLSLGYRITRELSALEQREPGTWHRGDVMRVRLAVEAQTDMGWVALLDPVPAGSTLLGTGLGGDSATLAGGEQRKGWVWPAFEERTQDSFRAYYRFVPKGSFSLEYTLRLNNEGLFHLPPTRVEAMYAPELFAELPLAPVHVLP